MNTRITLSIFTLLAGCVAADDPTASTEQASTVSNEQQLVWSQQSLATPAIAIDPTSSHHLIATSMTATGGILSESYDDGATWQTDELYSSWGAMTAFDADGLAVQCRSVARDSSTPSVTTVGCYRKHPGDRAWSAPTYLTTGIEPAVAVDRTRGSYGGSIYVAYRGQSDPYHQQIIVGASRDHGQSFTLAVAMSQSHTIEYPSVTTGPSGEVYVAWLDATTHQMISERSLDGGVHWSIPQVIHTWLAATGNEFGQTLPASPNIEVPVRVMLDVDRSTGPHRGTLYAVYADATASNGWDVFLQRSTDGLTWSAPVRVNDDPAGIRQDQFLPQLAVDDADGALDVVWYDTRIDATDRKTRLYYARSVDGGVTFSANAQLSSASADMTVWAPGEPEYGYQLGLATGGREVHPMWLESPGDVSLPWTMTAVPSVFPNVAAPDFTIATDTQRTYAQRGGTATMNITITTRNGFTSPISLSVVGAWCAQATTLAPLAQVSPTVQTSALTLTAPSDATCVPSTLAIIAKGGGITRIEYVQFAVVSPFPSNELIAEGGFSDGFAFPWQLGPRWATFMNEPGSVSYVLLGNANLTNATLEQTITIPANATAVSLGLSHLIRTQETTTTIKYDTLSVQVVAPGQLPNPVRVYSNLDASTSWSHEDGIDLSAYRGQTVTLRFSAVTDSSLPTSFAITDVSVAYLTSITPTMR